MTAWPTLFVFRSDKSADLGGFSHESKGARLPAKLGPWAGIGVIRPDQTPPHGLPRKAIETGIAATGYQLFRHKNPDSPKS
jgi:hypothetical protein